MMIGVIWTSPLHRLHFWPRLLCHARPQTIRLSAPLLRPVDRTTGLLCDQIVTLTNPSPRWLPDKCGAFVISIPAAKTVDLLTNNFTLPPLRANSIAVAGK